MRTFKCYNMKTIFKEVIMMLTVIAFFSSCQKDGDKLVATNLEQAKLTATASELVLTENMSDKMVFQLVWNQPEPQIEEGYDMADAAIATTLQFATDENFANVKSESTVSSSGMSYTGADLNTLILKMGLTAGERSTVYARIKSTIGANISPVYSNVIALAVTPYKPAEKVNYLYMANTDLTNFDLKLCSRDNNGVYDGFVKVNQWYNFLLTNEATANADVIYGSYPADGNQYTLYSGAGRWSCWTSNGGYLYIKADVNNLKWSETVINSLSVTGDFNGWSATATPMTYDAAKNVWTVDITTTAAEQWGIKILINGSWDFFFGAGEETGVCKLSTSSSDSGFPYTVTGTHKLTLDLSDPKAFKYTIE